MTHLIKKIFLTIVFFSFLFLDIGASPIKIVECPNSKVNFWYIHQPSLPLIRLSLIFEAKRSEEPVQGLCEAIQRTLFLTAGDLNEKQFSEKLEKLRGSISFLIYNENFEFIIQAHCDDIKELLNLIALSLTHSKFANNQFDTILDTTSKGRVSVLNDPGALINIYFHKHLLGEHPFVKKHNIIPNNKNRITQDLCQKFMAEHIGKDNIVISAIGAILPDELATILDDFLSTLPETTLRSPLPPIALNLQNEIHVIRRQQPQSICKFIQLGLSHDHADYVPFEVLRHIIGSGGFQSILMKKLRNATGSVYGISLTKTRYTKETQILQGDYETENLKFPQTYQLIMDIWRDLKENGPKEEEFNNAKNNYIGSLTLNGESNYLCNVNELSCLQFLGFPIDHYKSIHENLPKVTYEDVKRVAQLHLDPAHLIFFVEGDPPQCENINYIETSAEDFITAFLKDD
ncbi:MAG: insulinase family protein [Alphaproteobacteria bacterium]|nr:insulinase family protein [Alphaproteobacteria bacterium]